MAFIPKDGIEREGIPMDLHSYPNTQQVNSSTIASTPMLEDIVVALVMCQKVAKHG